MNLHFTALQQHAASPPHTRSQGGSPRDEVFPGWRLPRRRLERQLC